jgi:rod shape-determining protein MreD
MEMGKISPARIVGNRVLYFAIGMVGIFIMLTPITMAPSTFFWPEVMLLIAFALIIRNPIFAPFWLIGFVVLIGDMLLARPLGLGAFTAVLATEFLRRNRPAFVEMLFLGEWFSIALLLLATGILRTFLLAITLAESVPFWGFVTQLGLSILAYPVVVGIVVLVFKARKSEDVISHPVRRQI